MNKELQALERIKNAPTIYVGCASDIYTRYSHECKIIEKSLKALEIIKKKKVNLEYLKCCENYGQYCLICSYGNEITKEEYEILKEVLL